MCEKPHINKITHHPFMSRTKPQEHEPLSSITDKTVMGLNPSELVTLVNELTLTHQDAVFTQYKTATARQLRANQEEIELLKAELLLLRGSRTELQLPIKKTPISGATDFAQELSEIGHTLDILELLTGLCVVDFRSQQGNYYFDIEQWGGPAAARVKMAYQLVVAQAELGEVMYNPTFLDNPSQGTDTLREVLPDYLLESLTFPVHTLGQFYQKVARALSKK